MIYVPPFILSNLRRGKLRGQLNAFVLVCELANSGQVIEHFQKQRQAGAEKLGGLLGRMFDQWLEAVEERGGFIARMYGDSLLAVFPRPDPRQVLAAVAAVGAVPGSLEPGSKGSARPELKTRLLLGYGRIDWQIFSNPLQHEFLFSGRELEALDQFPRGEQPLLLTAGARRKLKAVGLLDHRGNPVGESSPDPLPRKTFAADPEVRASFVHPRLRDLKPQSNFRRVACTLVSLECDAGIQVEQVIQDMELIAITFGSFVYAIHKCADSHTALTFAGLPRSIDKAAQKACRTALDALKKYPRLRHGIAVGTVFSGIVGGPDRSHYAICGPVIDLATKLGKLARPGEILTDAGLSQELSGQFIFQPVARDRLPQSWKQEKAFLLREIPAADQVRFNQTFVGRRKELGRLKTLVRNCVAGGKNLAVHICGDPGIGKTRLVREILSSDAVSGCRVFELGCDASQTPLDAAGQLFRQLFPFDPELDHQQATNEFRLLWKNRTSQDPDLSRLESHIGAILGLYWPGSPLLLSPPKLRLGRMLEAGAQVLKELAAQQPLLINIDDLQWLDPQSRGLFKRLGSLAPSRTCILATSRYLEDGSVPILEPANFSSHRFDLGPLNLKDTCDLHRALLGVDSLPPATVDKIRKKFNGNPFAIEQVIALFLERGMVNGRGEYKLPRGWERFDLNNVLLLRINHLTAKTRECIDHASVLGMRFNIRVLSQMLNSDALRELAGGTRNRFWKDLGEVFYIFSHALIREAAYSRIMGGKLRKLHLSAAEALEKVFELELDDHAEEIAAHYEKAGRLEQAASYYNRAADQYWRSSLFDRLESNVNKAMTLSATACGTDSAQYCEYSFHMAVLCHYLLRFREAEPLYLDVIRIAKQVHGPRSPALSPYLNNLGRFYKDTGRYAKGEALLRRSLAIERKLNPISSNVADRINNLGHLYAIRDQFDKAEVMFLEALQIMETNYDPGHFFTGTVCGNLGAIYQRTGQLGKARKLLNRALEISYAYWGRESPVTAIYLANLAGVHKAWKHFAKAETLYLKALDNVSGPFGKNHSRTLSVVSLLHKLATERGDQKKAKFYADWLAGAKENSSGL